MDTHPQVPHLRVEDQAKRYRVTFGGETIADSVRTKLLFEGKYHPVIYFPLADVRQDLLTPTAHTTTCPHKGVASYWSVQVGTKAKENVVWGYKTPLPGCEGIAGHVSFYWKEVDGWLEEDTPLLGHARNPYSRIDTLRSSRRVTVKHRGEVIADTTRAVFLYETGLPARYYIPRADVKLDRLQPSELKTVCPYKGEASYFAAPLASGEVKEIAWYYKQPWPEVALIKDTVAFYPDRVDSIEVADK
ncbi:MAG TPA: DUF427 domain-containing protein [Kiloniellales bacterium]|nr:DUF427 domain-containing protein [Kiloniellales bacterium]